MAVHTKALLEQLKIPTYHFHEPKDADEFDGILNHTFMAKKLDCHSNRRQLLEFNIMRRVDIIEAIIPVISDELVVSNIGLPSQELHMLDDQPTNFYMLGTMGLTSSIGLGLALSQKETVIAIDGDGSILTNLRDPSNDC